MKLIEAVHKALKGDWSLMKEIIGDIHPVKDGLPEHPSAVDLFVRAKSLLFIKSCSRPEIKVGDSILVYEKGRIVKAIIETQDKEIKTCYLYRTAPGDRIKMLCANHGLWGVYPYQLPDFRTQGEYYLKTHGTVEEIGCCGWHDECIKIGKCISNSYEENGIVYKCALASKLTSNKKDEPLVKPSAANQEPLFGVGNDGQLTLF